MPAPKARPSIESLPLRLSLHDVADFYDQHPRTIDRGIKSGKLDIPYLRIGRNIYFRREDIAAYEARRLYLGIRRYTECKPDDAASSEHPASTNSSNQKSAAENTQSDSALAIPMACQQHGGP
jgi:hypothetical protein